MMTQKTRNTSLARALIWQRQRSSLNWPELKEKEDRKSKLQIHKQKKLSSWVKSSKLSPSNVWDDQLERRITPWCQARLRVINMNCCRVKCTRQLLTSRIGSTSPSKFKCWCTFTATCPRMRLLVYLEVKYIRLIIDIRLRVWIQFAYLSCPRFIQSKAVLLMPKSVFKIAK